jgi:outer membrane protein OmpA-like peptidoglycan-associated protein
MRIPRNGLVGLLALPFLVGGCGEVLENVPPRPAAIEDPAVAEADFPSLASVPARPQLSYTLEQRREIAEGLVADRANARYAGDDLRRALARPVAPDTAPPLPPRPAEVERASGGDPGSDLTLAYVEEALARDSDDGSLNDFLDRLQQPPPAAAEILPPVESEAAGDIDRQGPPAGATASAVDTSDVVTRSADPTTERESAPATAVTTQEPMSVSMAEPAAEDAAPPVEPATSQVAPVVPSTAGSAAVDLELPLAILFEPDHFAVDTAQHAKLLRLAPQLAGTTAAIVVSGGGARAGLAMERARRVAATLVEGGVLPTRIAIEMGGESDVVVVYESGA